MATDDADADDIDCAGVPACGDAGVGGTGVGAHAQMASIVAINMIEIIDFMSDLLDFRNLENFGSL